MIEAYKKDLSLKERIKHYGEDNGRYIDGRSSKIYYCKCGNIKDRRAIMCKKCDGHASMKGKHHTKTTKKLIGMKSKQKFTSLYIQKYYRNKCQGNKKRSVNGYILIKDYQHSNRNNDNDVLEHGVIMAKHLKRTLKKGEIVHHINFIRDDNRLRNLYLYKNRSEHGKCTKSLFKLVKHLLNVEIIQFKNGVYVMKGKKTAVGDVK